MLINRNIIVVKTESVRFFFGSRLYNRSEPRSPHCLGFVITLRHTTIGSSPLEEWSDRSRDLYLKINNTLKRLTSMPRRDSNLQSQQASGCRPTPYRQRGHWAGPVSENMQNFSPKLILKFFLQRSDVLFPLNFSFFCTVSQAYRTSYKYLISYIQIYTEDYQEFLIN